MLAKALGVELDKKNLDFQKDEHLGADFLKINPQHTVPTIVDKDFILWESRAILAYFCDKYAKDDSLYPKDPQKRALINQRLYFDMGTLYQRSSDYYFPILLSKAVGDPEKLKKMEEGVALLDTFLASSKYAAGDEITLAEYSILPGVSLFATVGFDYSRYKNVTRWYDLCKTTLKGVEENDKLIAEMKGFMNA